MVIAGTIDRLVLRKQVPPERIEGPDGKELNIIEAVQSAAPQAYISLTDVPNDTKLKLQLVSLSDNRIIIATGITLPPVNRLSTIQLVVPLPPLNIPSPGVYAFEVVCDDEIVGSHRIVVELDEEDKGTNGI